MTNLRLLGWTILFCLFATILSAQQGIISEAEIIRELEKRNLTIEEVELALFEKGIALSDLENISPEEIQILEQTILELEQNKKVSETQRVFKSDTIKPIKQDTILLKKDTMGLVEEEEDFKPSEIYGHDLFRNNTFRVYQESSDIIVSQDYIVDTGDELSISIWGRSQLDRKYIVSSSGYIQILNNAKRVLVRGLSLSEVNDKLYNVFRQYYKFNSGEFDVSVSASRVVKINIYGEVNMVGAQNLPGTNNAINALAAAEGPTELGSVRNIQLIKSSGSVVNVDVYEFMTKPQNNAYSLSDGDNILVPVAENIVEIDGGIKRPHKYELKNGEGILDLLKFAGGTTDNALLSKVVIRRKANDQERILDINLRDLKNRKSNFKLFNGDFIQIDTLVKSAINFVEVIGEVDRPGLIERQAGMTVNELLEKVGLNEGSRTDLAFIKRLNPDSTIQFVKIYIDDILKDKSSPSNVILQNQDLLTVWPKKRFTDSATIHVQGSVRYPDEFPFDISQSIKLKEAITLAGGPRRDTSEFVVIHRKDPLNPNSIQYITIDNLKGVLNGSDVNQNVNLLPFDSLVVVSKNNFLESSFVQIDGAVHNPNKFQFGEGMNIKDLMVLAGGFKLGASKNNIEISRLIIQDNAPIEVLINQFELDSNFEVVNNGKFDGQLQPYDRIAVRSIPEFELQESVVVFGEVRTPGSFQIRKNNETISSIIKRAGGFTEEAFPEGATLFRSEDDYGSIIIKLDENQDYINSSFDFEVRGGDTINIPKSRQFVTIRGATNVRFVFNRDVINEGNEIHVPYEEGKNALYYIKNYAGGFNENADKSSLTVKYPNGETKRTTGFIIKKYPKVKKGSIVSVDFNPPETNLEKESKNINWTNILNDSVAQAMSILTLLLLVQQVN